jgi:hypothetical protein
VELLKSVFLVNWDGTLLEENVLAGSNYTALDRYRERSCYKARELDSYGRALLVF